MWLFTATDSMALNMLKHEVIGMQQGAAAAIYLSEGSQHSPARVIVAAGAAQGSRHECRLCRGGWWHTYVRLANLSLKPGGWLMQLS